MNYFFRYRTLIDLLTTTPSSLKSQAIAGTKGISKKSSLTLDEISDELEKLGVYPNSKSTLSKITKLDNVPKTKRSDNSIKEKYAPFVLPLEKILEKHTGYVFVEKENMFTRTVGGEIQTKKLNEEGTRVKKTQQVEDAGIVKIHETLKTDALRGEIATCKTEVCIFETFLTDFESWRAHFIQALKNGCTIKILLASPRSYCAQLRSKGLRYDLQVKQRVENNIEQCRTLIEEYPEQFLIKLYDEIPPFNLYWYGNTMLLGWFWYGKYTLEGSFLELNAINKSSIVSDIKSQWNDLWKAGKAINHIENVVVKGFDVGYKCFFIRDGELQNFNLYLNPKENLVIITHTKSGDDYSGEFRLLDGYLFLTAETNRRIDNRSHKDRIASMLINTNNAKNIGEQEIAIATYSNISPGGRAYANLVVLVKLEDGQLTDGYNENRINQIESFLKGTEIAANISLTKFADIERIIASRIKNSDISITFLSKIAGEYYLFTDFKDREKTRKLRRIAVVVKSTGEVTFHGGVKKTEGQVKILNAQFIQMEKTTSIGATSYNYILQADSEEGGMNFFGYAVGVSLSNSPRRSTIWMTKAPEEGFDKQLKEYSLERNENFPADLMNEKSFQWFLNNSI